MAIVTEQFYVGERLFIRTYSDAGRYVVGGEPYGEYSEACDPAEFGRTYVEGDVMTVGESEADEILDIILGVKE